MDKETRAALKYLHYWAYQDTFSRSQEYLALEAWNTVSQRFQLDLNKLPKKETPQCV